MRSINLTTSILAPIVMGQVITFGSNLIGTIVIALWNLTSAVMEYRLLLDICKEAPALLNPKKCPHQQRKERDEEHIPFVHISPPSSTATTSPPVGDNITQLPSPGDLEILKGFSQPCLSPGEVMRNSQMCLTPGSDFEDVALVTPIRQQTAVSYLNPHSSLQKGPVEEHVTKDTTEFWTCGPWKKYFSHHVKLAGLALACLYMTVLGFDSITVGFAYSQGVSESIIGVSTAFGGIFGILGSISFPYLRRKLGKNATGILGFGLETLMLVFCLVSVFLPGSPFQASTVHNRFSKSNNFSTITNSARTEESFWQGYYHIVALLVGIILARYGLWIADLSVTQIFQEEVEESQRGIISGVQDSLNKAMDLFKFALVILLPSPETFGYLIMGSWLFVFLGSLLFLGFVNQDKKRGKGILHKTAEEVSPG